MLDLAVQDPAEAVRYARLYQDVLSHHPTDLLCFLGTLLDSDEAAWEEASTFLVVDACRCCAITTDDDE